MSKNYKFKKDQIIKWWDGFIDSYHFGKVTGSTKHSVTIQWVSGNIKTYWSTGDEWKGFEVVRKAWALTGGNNRVPKGVNNG